MRIVIQRVQNASVSVENKVIGEIDEGYMILVGVGEEDSEKDAEYLADKTAGLRLFDDDEGKINLSIKDVGGSILAISQFTLYADTKKGKRPSFVRAAKQEKAERLYEYFMSCLKSAGLRVEKGQFGAHMKIDMINDGPVTILIDSNKTF